MFGIEGMHGYEDEGGMSEMMGSKPKRGGGGMFARMF